MKSQSIWLDVADGFPTLVEVGVPPDMGKACLAIIAGSREAISMVRECIACRV